MWKAIIGVGLIVLLAWIGCGTEEEIGSKARVKLMGWGDTTTMAKYKILEEAFERENPDVDLEVEILDMNTYNQKLPILIASRTAPDILECGPERASSFPSYASKGAYVDLEPLIQRDGVDLDQWFPAVIQSCRYEGTLYVLPKKLNMPGCVHYNMDLFDAEGLPYPSRDWTWAEVLDLARKLTKDIDGDGRMDQWGLAWPFARGYEGPMMKGWSWTKANGREVNIDDPLFYETMQWMADLIHVERVAPTLEQVEGTGATVDYLLFTTGKVAMQSGGRWQTAIYKREIRTFKLTERSLENLKAEAVPDSVLDKLERMKNRKLNQGGMSEKEELRDLFRETIGVDEQTIGVILKHVEMEDLFRWDTVWLPVPEKGAKRRYQIASEAWGIYRGSKMIEEAWKVLKWVSGPNGSAVLGRIGGAVPAVKSVAYSPDFLESHPPSPEGNLMWLEAMEYAVRPPSGPEWAKIMNMMDEPFKLGWNGQRSFKELCLELKPKLDRLLQEK